MLFKVIFRVLIVLIAGYGLLIEVPKYSAYYCDQAVNASSAPCNVFRAAQPHFEVLHSHFSALQTSFSNYLEHQQWAHTIGAQACSLKAKAASLQLDERAKATAKVVYAHASDHYYGTFRPHVIAYSRKSYEFSKLYARNFYRDGSTFVKTKAWPLIKEHGQNISVFAREYFWKLWARFEQSHFWSGIVVPQVKKIYQTYAKRVAFQNATNTENAVTASEDGLAISKIVTEQLSTSSEHQDYSSINTDYSKTIEAESTKTDAAEPFVVESSVIPEEATKDIQARDAGYTPAPIEVSLNEINQDKDLNTESPKRWLFKVERTVNQALQHLENDAQEVLTTILADARPEITELLREIPKLGEKAVRDLTEKAEALESGSSLFTEEDVYPAYDGYVESFPELAFAVRDRVELLANEALAQVDSVRLVTLDAIDDYFDIMISEVARHLSEGEWDGWKEYQQLKQNIKNYRKQIEGYEFSMEKVNNALHESQTASLILSQEYIQQLTNLRARCQLVLQGNDSLFEEKGESESVEGNADTTHNNEEVAKSREPNSLDFNIKLEEDVLAAPVTDDTVVIDDLETVWETHIVTQTII